MKIVIATDSFKGSLDAASACEAIRAGVLDARPDAKVMAVPVADGGEGTAAVLMTARGGSWVTERVTGPLQEMSVEAGFAWFPADRTAVVEMASASGITLLRREQLNPLVTTTYGTGELLRRATDHGAERILLAVGGSATVDGGVGAAMALGWRFLDASGRDIDRGGGELRRIARIRRPEASLRARIDVLADVTNPLCGDRGAARVFGPQKRATPEMVEQLEEGLAHLADLVEAQLGADIRDLPGGGAAGGLAAGAAAFMQARIVPGIDTVIRETRLAEALAGADWMITGEGCFDEQSLHGKVVDGVARAARAAGARVAVLAGTVRIPAGDLARHGVDYAAGLVREGITTEDAMRRAGELLREAARRWAVERA